MHTLHRGRGAYVVIHADEVENGGKARIETFVVGHDSARGEKLQWIVAGGKYKASFLLPDEETGTESGGLLISEVSFERKCTIQAFLSLWILIIFMMQTVVPGFEYSDHTFMAPETLDETHALSVSLRDRCYAAGHWRDSSRPVCYPPFS